MWVSTEGWIGGQTQELACSAKCVVSPRWNGIKALVQQPRFWQVEAGVGTIALFALLSIPLLLAFQKKREGCVQEHGDASLPRSDLDLISCSLSTKTAKSSLDVAGSEEQGCHSGWVQESVRAGTGKGLVGHR